MFSFFVSSRVPGGTGRQTGPGLWIEQAPWGHQEHRSMYVVKSFLWLFRLQLALILDVTTGLAIHFDTIRMLIRQYIVPFNAFMA